MKIKVKIEQGYKNGISGNRSPFWWFFTGISVSWHLFHMDIKKEKGLVVDRETGLMVRRIFEMAAEGVPKTHIAKRLNQEGILNSVTLRKERGGRFYRKQAGKGGKSGIG